MDNRPFTKRTIMLSVNLNAPDPLNVDHIRTKRMLLNIDWTVFGDRI